MQGRWDFSKPSKHGDYAIFVGAPDDGTIFVLTADEYNEASGECLVIVHDNTMDGLTADQRNEISMSAVVQTIYWNDYDSYYWCFDWKVAGHWCEMWHGNDDEPYYLAQHINVID